MLFMVNKTEMEFKALLFYQALNLIDNPLISNDDIHCKFT